MYTSTFLTLNTALSGVEVAQEELETTGNNISSANTPGYEKQVVNTTEMPSLLISAGAYGNAMQLGEGVTAQSVTNQDNPYLNAAWRQQNAATSAADTLQTYTQQIQTALNEPSQTGISQQLSQFWSDWSALANNPTSTAAKQVVVDDAQGLADSFNNLSSELTGTGSGSVLSQAVDQYNNLLAPSSGAGQPGGEVYNDAQQIAELNQQIVYAQQGGGDANALLDQRNQYLDDLSSLGNVQVVQNTDGSVTVNFGGVTGQPLVDGSQGANGNEFSNWQTAFQTAATGSSSAASLAQSFGGTLGALIGLTGYPPTAGNASPALEGQLGQIQDQIDTIANDLGQNVNNPDDLYNGTGAPTALSTPLFGTSATQTFTGATLTVNAALANNPSLLQAGNAAATGDNSVALAESAIGGEQGVSFNGVNYPANPVAGTTLPGSSYAAFVQYVGSIAQAANQSSTTQSALQTQATNQRTSAEGVDLSEEMTNLIEEQQAYEASAKVMNAFGSMMDSLMTTVGQ